MVGSRRWGQGEARRVSSSLVDSSPATPSPASSCSSLVHRSGLSSQQQNSRASGSDRMCSQIWATRASPSKVFRSSSITAGSSSGSSTASSSSVR